MFVDGPIEESRPICLELMVVEPVEKRPSSDNDRLFQLVRTDVRDDEDVLGRSTLIAIRVPFSSGGIIPVDA